MAAPSQRSSLRLAQILLMPAHPASGRQPSLELDQNENSPPTCRPKRKSAGKKVVNPDYVDSTLLELEDFEENFEDFSEMSEESSDHVESEEERRPRKKGKKDKKNATKKRKRSPSPSPPPLSPMHSDVEHLSDTEDLSDVDGQGIFSCRSPQQHRVVPPIKTNFTEPMNLTFHVPQGFTGPFVVQLNPSMFTSAGSSLISSPISEGMESRPAKSSRSTISVQSDKSVSPSPSKGFLKLPPELRNKVYRTLFHERSEFKFWQPDNFCHSAALLRTCKQVCAEGASILYGENTFCFERNRHSRSQYWAAQRKEIGYKDMRRFLTDIGPTNISYMRKLQLTFEDCNPSSAPHECSIEGRRFVYDEHLLECLRLLVRHAKLKWLRLSFQGRRKVTMADQRFVDILNRLRTDKLEIVPNPRYAYHSTFSKLDLHLEQALKKKLVRTEKLYLTN